MDIDMKECLVVENETVQVIVIKKTDCSMVDAVDRAIDRLRQV